MSLSIEPLQVNSLTGACITRLEELVLSGELRAGERLPAERDLAARLGVSRPVLHEALLDLSAKGLVTILPRRGVVVNDYRKSGSTAILSSLLSYHQGDLDTRFVRVCSRCASWLKPRRPAWQRSAQTRMRSSSCAAC